MLAIVNKLYLLILLSTVYTVYTRFEEHQVNMENLKNKIPSINKKIKQKQKDKKALENYFADIEEAKARIERVAAEIEKLQRQFPSQISDTDNLGQISTLAESLNIKNIFLTPQAEENKGFYYTKSYLVKASGTFLQFLIFLEKISESERLMNIRDIKLLKSQKKQKGRFQVINAEMNIEVYKYNNNYRESRGINEIEQQFKKAKPKRRKKRRRK